MKPDRLVFTEPELQAIRWATAHAGDKIAGPCWAGLTQDELRHAVVQHLNKVWGMCMHADPSVDSVIEQLNRSKYLNETLFGLNVELPC